MTIKLVNSIIMTFFVPNVVNYCVDSNLPMSILQYRQNGIIELNSASFRIIILSNYFFLFYEHLHWQP